MTASSSNAADRTHAASSPFNIAPVITAALGFASHRPSSPASYSYSSSSSGTPIPSRRPQIPNTRSRGQLARRNSTNLTHAQNTHSGQLQLHLLASGSSAHSHIHTAATDLTGRDLTKRAASRSQSPSRRREHADSYSERPLLGGLYFSDLVVVAFFYALNLVRTLGLAELADVVLKGLAWAIVALPKEFWHRWSLSATVYSIRTHQRGQSPPEPRASFSTSAAAPLSQPASSSAPIPIPKAESPLPDRSNTPIARTHRTQYGDLASSTSSASTVMPSNILSPFPSSTEPPVPLPQSSFAFSSFAEQQQQQQQEGLGQNEASRQEKSPTHDQLSPFHHLIILLTRFACSNFPHLIPRVLFAEDTIGPLVRWRTGGGAAGLVREFGAETHSRRSARSSDLPTADRWSTDTATDDDEEGAPPTAPSFTRTSIPAPAFRAFWIGTDAHVPPQVRREREKPDPNRPPGASERAPTTILYLHGGGFSLGSVAFYAEALIRTLGKICILEQAASARCIAVEYDLAPAPTARFPAPLLQCLRCYAHLIEVEGIPAESITIAGDSAGANLAMGILLCLNGGSDIVSAASEPGVDLWAERNWSELPMPGQAVLISPWADLRPRKAITFAKLRGEQPSTSADLPSEDPSAQPPSASDAKLRDAISGFEWDYVLPETLLHFAQVYTGVMEVPRRVRGPIGWISHVCGIVGAALEKIEEDAARPAKRARGDTEAREADDTSSSGAGSRLSRNLSWARQALAMLGDSTPAAVGAFARVPRRMTLALKEMLDEPLLGFGAGVGPALDGSGAVAPGVSSAVVSTTAQGGGGGLVGPRATHGLAPLFPAQERRTETVPGTSDLFVPFTDADVPAASEQPSTMPASGGRSRTPEEAARLLDTSPLISPATADWSSIRLERGMLVTWGERERLASDIEAWVRRIRAGVSGPSGGDKSMDKGEEGSALDDDDDDEEVMSEAETERGHVSASADWLRVAVEHGPGGVHAWPFVSMYLAGTENEREKGLELLARFIAQEPLALLQAAVAEKEKKSDLEAKAEDFGPGGGESYDSTPGSFSSSAGSMPSDAVPYGEETNEDYYGGEDAPAGMRTSERISSHQQIQRESDFYHHQQQAFHARPPSARSRSRPGESMSDVMTEGEEEEEGVEGSSEGSSSPEGRVTALGVHALELESSVGLGLGPLPPPMMSDVAATTTTRSSGGMSYPGAVQAQAPTQTQAQAQVHQGNPSGYASYPYASAYSTASGPSSAAAARSYPSSTLAYSGHTYQPAVCYVEEAARQREAQEQQQRQQQHQLLQQQQQQHQQLRQQQQQQEQQQQQQQEESEQYFEEEEEEEEESSGMEQSDFDEEEEEEEGRSRGLEDIEEVSEGALSPDSYPTSPAVSDAAAAAARFSHSLSALPIQIPVPVPADLGFFGFSHYTTEPNREPEGLSDIMEEGSVLSASVTSGGGGGAGEVDWVSSLGATSPSIARQVSPFMFGSGMAPVPTYGTVTAGEVGYFQASAAMEAGNSLEGVTSEQGEVSGDDDEEEGEGEEEESADPASAELEEAFSPPATQPGPSLRTIYLQRHRQSQGSVASTEEEGPDGRKKPKAEVWW